MRRPVGLLAVLLAVSFAVVGCGEGPLSGGPPSIQGTWNYEAELPKDGCTATAVLEFSQSSGAVSGGARNLVIDCGGDERAENLPFGLSGTNVDGNSIAFEFFDFQHAGTVSGDQMSGQANGRLEVQLTPTTVDVIEGDANWTATRQ